MSVLFGRIEPWRLSKLLRRLTFQMSVSGSSETSTATLTGSRRSSLRCAGSTRRYTILQLGDYGFDHSGHGTHAVDYWAHKAGIERFLVTLGNHEEWNKSTPA